MGSGLSMTSVNKIKELAAAREYSLALDIIESQELSRSLNPQFLRLCGEVYVHTGKYESAREVFIMARKLAPEAKRIMSDLVDLYYRMGYFKLADTYYETYMFDADPLNNETKQLEYIRAKALDMDKAIMHEKLGDYYADNLDYDWSFELFMLYVKLGETDRAKLLHRDYEASFKQSENVEIMTGIFDGKEDIDEYFKIYATEETQEDEASDVSREERKLLEADELRMHPKEPEITIMIDDNDELTLGEKRKYKKFIKEFEKHQAEGGGDETDSVEDDENGEQVLQPEEKSNFFGKIFGKNKKNEKTETVEEAPAEETVGEVVSVEETPVEETPVEESVDEVASVEEIDEEVVPVKEILSEESFDEDALVEEFSVSEEVSAEDTQIEDVVAEEDTAEAPIEEDISDDVSESVSELVMETVEAVKEQEDESVEMQETPETTETEKKSSFVFEEMELVEEEDSEAEIDDFSQQDEEEFFEIKLEPMEKAEAEIEEEVEAEIEEEVETEIEEEIETEVEAEEEVETEIAEEVEVEIEEEIEPEIEEEVETEIEEEFETEAEEEIEAEIETEIEEVEAEIGAEEEIEAEIEEEIKEEIDEKVEVETTVKSEHNTRSIFSPENISKNKDDYPVFRSSLFPDYNNEREEVSNNFDEVMDEAQHKMRDNILKEEQMQREAEILLASLGISLDDIKVSDSDKGEMEENMFAMQTNPNQEKMSREELKKTIQIDDRKKDILRRLKEFR